MTFKGFELEVDPDDEDDIDEEKMIRTELMNISSNNSSQVGVKFSILAAKLKSNIYSRRGTLSVI